MSEPTTPTDSYEVAVLYTKDNRHFAWPIFSIAKSGKDKRPILSDKRRSIDFDSRLYATIQQCGGFNSDRICPVPKKLVLQYHRMSNIPNEWFDSKNRTFSTVGGSFYGFAFGQGGEDMIGFSLTPPTRHHIDKNYQGVLASHPEIFAAKISVPIDDSNVLPFLSLKRQQWKKGALLTDCNARCDYIPRLAANGKIAGTLTRYRLSGDRTLEHIDATSRPGKTRKPKPDENTEPIFDQLTFDIWRMVDSEGNAKELKAGDNRPFGIPAYYPPGVSAGKVDCESQCPLHWESLDVIEADERIFVIGQGAGGEVVGYYFFKIIKNTMTPLDNDAYTGGS